MIHVRRLGIGPFMTEVVPWLLIREVEHHLMLGLANRYAAGAEVPPDSVWLALEENGVLVGAAVRTPPQYVIVSELPPGAARALADFFIGLDAVPDGAIGAEAHGREVLLALSEKLGGRVELHSAETIYELSSVNDLPRPPGTARVATPSDLGVVTRFSEDFLREVSRPFKTDGALLAARLVDEGAALLWDDGGPRAMACVARRTEHGTAIAPVYTPPDSRRRGYGTAVTAELARRLLAADNRFVCLFAEQKNQTANHVYQTIGFRRVRDFNVWSLR